MVRGGAATLVAAIMMALCASCAIGPPEDDGTAEDYPRLNLTILAPGSPGGGWDTRARAIGSALTDCGVIDKSTTVRNSPGAAGTIGLAEFISNPGDPHQLLVMDTITMLGGIVENKSPVSLDDVTPIAGVTVASTGIVVPADSPYRSFEDLVAKFRAAPSSISWAGGSLGGPDHLLVNQLAKHYDLPTKAVNYVPTAGGGETMSLVVSDTADVALAGVSEVEPQIESGQLRALAVTGEDTGIEAPSLAELGLSELDVESVGGVVAPGDLSEAEQEAIIDMLDRMRQTKCWKKAMKRNAWQSKWLPGAKFGQQIQDHERQVTSLLRELG